MSIDGDADTAELSPLTPVTLSPSCSPPKKLQKMLIDGSVAISDLKEGALDLVAAFYELKGQHELLMKENIKIKKENSDVKTKLDKTNSEKDVVRTFLKRVVCPNKLRNSIEHFPIRFLSSIEAATRRQNELHQKLSSLSDANSLKILLCNCVRQIVKSVDKPNMIDSFKHAMKRLRNLNSRLVVKPSDELQNALFDLCNTSDDIVAEQLFSQQLDNVWRPRKNDLSEDDEEAIGKLVVLNIVDVLDEHFADASSNLSKMVSTAAEVRYLYDAVKINQLFEPNVSKHYKLCFWIFYIVKHPHIDELNQKMAEEWPNLSKAQRVHLYSQEFAQLFNIVSVMDKHGPGVQPPIDCVPDESDFNTYLDHLSMAESQNLIFVAKTLCLP